MEYNFREIEKKWHEYWIANKVYKVEKNCRQTKVLRFGHVPLSIRSRTTCRPPTRLYRF